MCRFITVMPSQLDLLSSCLNVFTQLVVSEPQQVTYLLPDFDAVK